MIVLPQAPSSSTKKVSKSPEMEFFSRTRDLTSAFEAGEAGEREGGRLPVLLLIYMNPKL